MEGIIVDGIKCYDPRDQTYKSTNNPALIFADLLDHKCISHNTNTSKTNEKFWNFISQMADYCDEEIKIGET